MLKTNKAILKIADAMTDPFSAYLSNKLLPIPSHITSIPAPRRVYGTDEMVIMAVQEAMEQGVLPKLDYPCTAHVMVYWKE